VVEERHLSAVVERFRHAGTRCGAG